MNSSKKSRKIIASVMALSILTAGISSAEADVLKRIIPVNSISASAASNEKTSGDYNYIIEDGKAVITKYNGSKTTVTIPQKLDSYPVVALDSYSFKQTNIKNVTIKSNIERLGYAVFEECPYLTTATIEGNPEFGRYIFMNCPLLSNVSLSDEITNISISMFKGCESLKNITLPSSLKTIEIGAFENCKSLSTIKIPKGVKVIDGSAFNGCTSLVNIEMPAVTDINDYAFQNCTKLNNVVFPKTIKNIGTGAFQNTTSLSNTIIFPQSLERMRVGAFDNSGIGEITLQSGKIDEGAINNCRNLYQINFSGNVVMERNAINNCPNLGNINVASVNTNYNWKNNSFERCPKLQYINKVLITRQSSPTKEPYFYSNYDSFVRKYFNGSENIGFINKYVDYYCNYLIKTKLTSDMTDVQKARVLHNWVIEKVEYEPDENNHYNPKNEVTSSVFMNDSTICYGYALGYTKLMNTAGIETQTIGNPTHAWNYIKINGQYFHVDCCFDAGFYRSSNQRYDFFLVKDDDIKKIIYHETWTSGLTPARYSMGDLNEDGKITKADSKLLLQWIARISAPTAAQKARADVNLDGSMDVRDAVLLERYFSEAGKPGSHYIANLISKYKDNTNMTLAEFVSNNIKN